MSERTHESTGSLPRASALANDRSAVELQGSPFYPLGVGAAADWNAARDQSALQGISGHTAFVGELLHASAGEVALSEVVDVREYDFAGHVYDLQATGGWLLAGGIVASNCRCILLAGGAPTKAVTANAAQVAHWKTIQAQLLPFDRALRAALQRAFESQHKAVMAALTALAADAA